MQPTTRYLTPSLQKSSQCFQWTVPKNTPVFRIEILLCGRFLLLPLWLGRPGDPRAVQFKCASPGRSKVSLAPIGNHRALHLSPHTLPHHWQVNPGLKIKSHLDFFEIQTSGWQKLHLETHWDTFGGSSALSSPSSQILLQILSLENPRLTSIHPNDLENTELAPIDEFSVHSQGLRSQMDFDHPRRREICSPTTAYHLCLLQHREGGVLREVSSIYRQWVEVNLNPRLQIFGLWPQAMWVAHQRGYPLRFKYHTSLKELISLLKKGPVGLSIAWNQGELGGAPLAQSKGHLLTLLGFDKEKALVIDSAHPHRKQVLTKYNSLEIFNLWQKHGGLVYFFDNSLNSFLRTEL